MKKILFGIALILFAILIALKDVYIPILDDFLSAYHFSSHLLFGAAGLVIAGIGAFKKDK